MSLTFNVMENDVLRPMFLKAQMDAELRGKLEGKLEGEAALLTRMLQRRFGLLPAWIHEKIAQAELPALEEWSLRIFDAHSLEEIFADRQ
ncbi:MAG: DUF4351 domain-containing protein [Magnetococcales bacterium]|nr:DUF4351 domain-containing protein [Magnetococcales bacterium]